ncbi:MAG: DUF4340 domain-containing protein [Saprospiraceae bacterium]|nr:DUF4340 domain-containing protein [Saprospiraceae bacterium]
MKNKHLVLLFIITLLIGLAVRRAPWRNDTFFQASLLRLDTAKVQQIQVTLPNQPVLFLLRGDTGWSAEQSDRSANVSADLTQKMLAALADMRSIRIVKTDRADTLGFTRANAIHITIVHGEAQKESLIIGWETVENKQAACYVQLPMHDGIYLVNNHLRNTFAKALSDFRNPTIAQFSPSDVRSFSLYRQNPDSIFFQKNDSTGRWESPAATQNYSSEQVNVWLSKIAGLHDLTFADLFDESHASESFYARINLIFESGVVPLTLSFYHFRPMNVPEEWPAKKPDPHQLAPFVLFSSQNPINYFAFSDTLLLRQIISPF